MNIFLCLHDLSIQVTIRHTLFCIGDRIENLQYSEDDLYVRWC